MQRIVVVHYGEIAIKGENRGFFEKQLVKNIKRALSRELFREIRRLRGRMLIYLADSISEAQVSQRLGYVFGVANFGFGEIVDRSMDAIKLKSLELIQTSDFTSFRVSARRSYKRFPLTSVEINKEVGAFIQEKCGKRVDLSSPDATVHIEITETEVFVYTDKTDGLRGLPVGVSERAVSLFSSGIDSPIASFLMLKRGVNLIYAHFHSQPFTNPASQENAEKLVQILNRYQFYSRIYFIPFIEIQKVIMTQAPSELRVLLYRRYMIRLSERIALTEGATALVTGENVGQVASQTLSNIRVVGEVTDLPILRPLAGFDKQEIVALARQIGTFGISTAPYEDCCSLFVPDNPATRAHPSYLTEAESKLEMSRLLDDAIAKAELKVLKTY